MNSLKLILFCVAAVILQALLMLHDRRIPPACGGGMDLADSLYLPRCVVSAKVQREIIPAQTLSGNELKGLNSFSVADAIRYFSGVQIKD